MQARTAVVERKTAETEIKVAINLDCQPGSGNKQEISVSTGIGFLDHVRQPRQEMRSFVPLKIICLDVPCIGETLWDVATTHLQRRLAY